MKEINISDFQKPSPEKKVGFVALVGRPNSGKSTFLNTLLGEKVSIVSPKPQTTQKNIKGIYNDEETQIVFFDTPGIHESNEDFNLAINDQARRALADADVIVRFIDVSRKYGDEEKKIEELLSTVKIPTIVVRSKTDIAIKDNTSTGMDLSSLERKGFDELLGKIRGHLSVGPLFYDEDYYTDQDMNTRISEIIREKLFLLLEEELPYSCFVEIEDIEDTPDLLRILCYIYVEKDSQKYIVLGKRGSMLQEIGTLARKELEEIFEKKVFLQTRIKTFPKWKKNKKLISSLLS